MPSHGTSRSASLTINAPVSTVDTVSITRGGYESSKRTLRVEATSTQSNATLKVFVTSSGQLIGTLTNDGSGRFRGQFSVSVNPQSITVRSSLGGQATLTVRAKQATDTEKRTGSRNFVSKPVVVFSRGQRIISPMPSCRTKREPSNATTTLQAFPKIVYFKPTG